MPVAQPTIFQILASDTAGSAVVLTFEGTGSPNGSVTVYDGAGHVIASGPVQSDGSYSISTSALTNGAHALTLTTTDILSGESAPTNAISVDAAVGASAALQSLDISQLPDSVVIDIS